MGKRTQPRFGTPFGKSLFSFSAARVSIFDFPNAFGIAGEQRRLCAKKADGYDFGGAGALRCLLSLLPGTDGAARRPYHASREKPVS